MPASNPVPEFEHVCELDSKLFDRFSLVEMAIKCFDINAGFFAACKNQSRAERALGMVSCVVKVFEEIGNNVVSGFGGAKVSTMSAWSTFETKWALRFSLPKALRAVITILGPANADVYNVANSLVCVASPFARASLFGKGAHFAKDCIDFRHYVLAAKEHRVIAAVT